MKKTIDLLLSVLLVVGLMAGCGGSSSGSEAAPAAGSGSAESASGSTAAAAPAGGEKVLNFGLESFSDGLINPMNQTNTAWNCMRYGVGECLFHFTDSMSIEPWLAESWTHSDDYTVWTIVLRDGVKFSNGDPLTATKVKAPPAPRSICPSTPPLRLTTPLAPSPSPCPRRTTTCPASWPTPSWRSST